MVCAIGLGGVALGADKVPAYKLLKRVNLGGTGGWDLMGIDSAGKRLYISHATHVVVFDTENDKVVADINNTPGVHGIAIATGLGKGYITCGKDNSVLAFDLKTLKTTRIEAGKNPDAIMFEPTTKRIFSFNGGSNDATVIDAAKDTVVGTIAVGGKPELAVCDGGKVFLNLEDKSEVVVIDAAKMIVTARWPLAPAEGPTGLAIDVKGKRLFSACGNNKMAVVDYTTGKVIATPEVGKGCDGAEFDAAMGLAFCPNGGDGTLSVRKEEAGGQFKTVQTVTTSPMARTMILDPQTHLVYLVTAKLKAPAPNQPDQPAGARPRRSFEPDSFEVLIVGPAKD
jgi:YVTN family beta-propeller protein